MEIKVNNIILNYTQSGKGYPVILLHGNGEDLHIFDKLTEKLKQHYTVYAIDSRNHGGSSKTDDYSYETVVEDIYHFIKQMKLEHVAVIGFSDGAIISLLLQLKYENIFDKLVLLGVNLKPDDFKEEIYGYLVEEYEKTKDPLVKMMLEQPQIELEELKRINVPTLVVAAEDDIYYRKNFTDIAETIPHAVLKIMQGHDHSSYIVNEDILYADLVQFLQ